MTKMEHIRQLYAGGIQSVREIQARTGYSQGYVANVVSDIRTPGALRAACSRWRIGHPVQAGNASKRWKHQHPGWRARQRRKNNTKRRKATLPTAQQRYQRWTITDLDFLRDHGKELTIVELALKLRRTAAGVQLAGHRYNIDLGYKEKRNRTAPISA